MSVLCSKQVETRSTSDTLTVADIATDVTLTSVERMELIAAVATEWNRATGDHPERHRARRSAIRRRPYSALAYLTKRGTK